MFLPYKQVSFSIQLAAVNEKKRKIRLFWESFVLPESHSVYFLLLQQL